MDDVVVTNGQGAFMISFDGTMEQHVEIAKGIAQVAKRDGMSLIVQSGSIASPDDVDMECSDGQVIIFIDGLTTDEVVEMNKIIRDIFVEDENE